MENKINVVFGWIGIFLVLIVLIGILPIIKAANVVGPNYHNVTVLTSVNVTNARPIVLQVIVHQETNASARNITLNAGDTRNITCNATVKDWNAYTDVTRVNATLWDNTVSSMSAADNNNSHYTNVNCSDSGNGNNYTVNYMCVFPVYYYANNGTWMCNVTAVDTYNMTGYNSNTTTVYPLYSLNITDGISFGNVPVEDISSNVTANISNMGNMAINVTVQGYGSTIGDGLAMTCAINGNITLPNERFTLNSSADFFSKTSLNGSQQMLNVLTMVKQTSSTLLYNQTYWQVFVNSTNNPGGNCSGHVIFEAQTP